MQERCRRKTGDGVGILLQISHKFFEKAAKNLGINIGKEREYGVGMFFFSQDEFKRKQAMKMFEIIAQKKDLNSSAGEKYLQDRKCWVKRHLMLCREFTSVS